MYTPTQFEIDQNNHPVSIVLAFRDDTPQVLNWLNVISNHIDHTVQLILVNDVSIPTPSLIDIHIKCESLGGQLLNLEGYNRLTNNKKQALDLGINAAKYPSILITDADAVPMPHWLSNMRYLLSLDYKFVAGIHRYSDASCFWRKLLVAEQDILSAISIAGWAIGSPNMCNGASMALDRSAYLEVNGYHGLYDIVGGDDMFIYHRIYHKFPNDTFYLMDMESAVYTDPPASIRQLVDQRKRWLSKSNRFESMNVKIQMLVIALGNITALLSLIFILVDSRFLGVWMVKVIIDLIFGWVVSMRWSTPVSFVHWLSLAIIYPIYSVLIGLLTWFNPARNHNSNIVKLS